MNPDSPWWLLVLVFVIVAPFFLGGWFVEWLLSGDEGA